MAFFLASILIFCLAITINEAGERCSYGSYSYCSNYCCSYGGYCCDSCSSSIYSHPECGVASIIGGIIGFIAFVVIISLIVACCCGCICSSRTGIQRRGRVLAQPAAAAVTVVSQDQTYYPQPNYTNSQGQVVYPPATIGNSDYKQAAYPVYPNNQGYITQPNQGYVAQPNQGYVAQPNQGHVNPPPYDGYYPEQK